MNTPCTRVLLQPAYVLHRRAFRDSSLLVELFTPQYGRVGMVARAARRSSSRLTGVLQPFRSLLVSWSGNGELPSLSGAEAEGDNRWLTGQTLLGGFYLNELVMRLLHRFDPHPDLYAVYHRTVQAFGEICRGGRIGVDRIDRGADASSAVKLECALRIFEKHLLEEIGYGLVLNHDAEKGRPIEPGQLYLYHLMQGPVRLDVGQAGVAPNRLVIRGQSLLDLARGCLEDRVSLREAKRLTRAALAEQLGERPLKSRSLFTPQNGHF
jgi:DNA repair protein RecO (recombination protein O)